MGVFNSSWDTVRAFVDGYSGARYSGFNSENEAYMWLAEQGAEAPRDTETLDGTLGTKRPSTGFEYPIKGRLEDLPIEDYPPAKIPRNSGKQPEIIQVFECKSSPFKEHVIISSDSEDDSFATCGSGPDYLAHNFNTNTGDAVVYPSLPPLYNQSIENGTTSKYFSSHLDTKLETYPANSLPQQLNLSSYHADFMAAYGDKSFTELPKAFQDDDFNSSIPSNRPQPPQIPLTASQAEVLDQVMAGKNVFFTGPAGSGQFNKLSRY